MPGLDYVAPVATRRDRRPEALPLDPGVLREGAVCEFQSDLAVAAHGGTVVQPWRDRFLAAEAAGLEVVPSAHEIPDTEFDQVVVHLQKSRAASFEDLREAWRILRPGGQLLFAGPNTLGIVSAVKRLAAQLGQSPVIVSNRARARVVRFVKDAGPAPTLEEEGNRTFATALDPIHGDPFEFELETRPGVFSARKLDAGSQFLLEALPGHVGHKPPARIVDLGCGTGVLGIAAALLWPESQVLLADADARAVECARANIERLGLGERCRVVWWDAREPPPDSRFGLALVNPPFHRRGMDVDLGPALALFASLESWIKPGARALLVANRTLPYERPLSEIGELETLRAARGYKLLSLKRRARSARSRGRRSPGARSGGRTNAPIRSR
ncbi:MAG TPA: class I SAM-dependent methyltransferase [Deltaproteobacteria bacterium]|nr:class I SAM-dependent methyltransferase [Deltaproteobacteria bacterium]